MLDIKKVTLVSPLQVETNDGNSHIIYLDFLNRKIFDIHGNLLDVSDSQLIIDAFYKEHDLDTSSEITSLIDDIMHKQSLILKEANKNKVKIHV